MIVYHYDPDTHVYLNTSSAADPDPLDPGKWLIPANATQLIPPPPPNPKTQQAVFQGSKWEVEDIPVPPALHANISNAPVGGIWPRISIKEALKGGVT